MTAAEELMTPAQARALLGELIGKTPSRGAVLRWRTAGIVVGGRVVKLAAARVVGKRQLIARAAVEAFASAVCQPLTADPAHAPETPAQYDRRAEASMAEMYRALGMEPAAV